MNIDFVKPYTSENHLDYLICSGNLYHLLKGSIYTPNEPDYFSDAERSHGLLFTGKPQSGKHITIDSLAGAAKNSGYELLEVSVIDLFGDNSISTMKNIKMFFDKIYSYIVGKDGEARLFIYIEDIFLFNDDTRAGMVFFRQLKKLLQGSSNPLLVVGAYDDVPSNVPEIYRSAMHIINIDPPAEIDRSVMLEQRMLALLNEEVSMEYLVKSTADFTKGEIASLVELTFMIAMGKAKNGSDEVDEFLYEDNVSSEILLAKDDIDPLIECIKKSRYLHTESENIKSVFNYPSSAGAVVMASGGAIPTVSSTDGNAGFNFDPMNNISDLKIGGDSEEPVDPYKTLNETLPDVSIFD